MEQRKWSGGNCYKREQGRILNRKTKQVAVTVAVTVACKYWPTWKLAVKAREVRETCTRFTVMLIPSTIFSVKPYVPLGGWRGDTSNIRPSPRYICVSISFLSFFSYFTFIVSVCYV